MFVYQQRRFYGLVGKLRFSLCRHGIVSFAIVDDFGNIVRIDMRQVEVYLGEDIN